MYRVPKEEGPGINRFAIRKKRGKKGVTFFSWRARFLRRQLVTRWCFFGPGVLILVGPDPPDGAFSSPKVFYQVRNSRWCFSPVRDHLGIFLKSGDFFISPGYPLSRITRWCATLNKRGVPRCCLSCDQGRPFEKIRATTRAQARGTFLLLP